MPSRRASAAPFVPPSVGPARVQWRLDELDDVVARATALMGPEPDEARALLDGIVVSAPVSASR